MGYEGNLFAIIFQGCRSICGEKKIAWHRRSSITSIFFYRSIFAPPPSELDCLSRGPRKNLIEDFTRVVGNSAEILFKLRPMTLAA